MSDSTDTVSLFDQYHSVKKLLDDWESGASSAALTASPSGNTAESRAEFMGKLLAAVTALDKAIEASDTFSSNEIVDDLSTLSLRYLSIAYHLGNVLLSMPVTAILSTAAPAQPSSQSQSQSQTQSQSTVTSVATRAEHVKGAKLAFMRFLDRCESLLLLSERAKKDLDALNVNNKADNDSERNSDSAKAQQQNQQDALTQRASKIDRFRREQSLRKQLQALEQKLAQRRARLVSASAGAGTGGNELEAAIEADSEAAETERELVLLQTEVFVDKAIVHLSFVKQEEALLAHGREEADEDRRRAEMGLPPLARGGNGSMPGLRPHGPALPPSGSGGNSSGGSFAATASAAAAEAPRPLRIHKIGDHDAAKDPIPEHMKDYMKHVAPGAPQKSTSAAGPAGGGVATMDGAGGEGSPFDKAWFKPSAHACEHCGDDDVTRRAGFTKYMMSKVVGGRGKLVPACPIHGNAHPAGQCPGLQAGRGGAGAGQGVGYPDPINSMVRLSISRAISLFRLCLAKMDCLCFILLF